MSKGFTLTLVTVALAMLGAEAQAMAPTIGDIPSPIVSNYEAVTGVTDPNGRFVFIDAMDLNTLVTDETPSADLLWTFTGDARQGKHGVSSYQINGVNPIDLESDSTDLLSPASGQIINKNDKDTVPGKDAKANTITIRNKNLSPLGGTAVAPTGSGIVNVEPVTFFVTDGTSYSQKSVFFYSATTGIDRLSPAAGNWLPAMPTDKIPNLWNTVPGNWNVSPGTGSTNNNIARKQWEGSGICLYGSPTGSNYGAVTSKWQYFNLAANQVYRFKMNMICSQTNASNMPFWDIVLENFDSSTGKGLNLYISDLYVFANEGGANAVSRSGSTVTWYWCPPAIATKQWAGAFQASYENDIDPRLRFRLMDVDGLAGAGNETKSGDICIREIQLDSIGLSSVKFKSKVVDLSGGKIATNNIAGTGNVEFKSATKGGSTAAFTGGTLTVTPAVAGAIDGTKNEMAEIRPASDMVYSAEPSNASSADNWPIPWASDEILRLQVAASAPDANSEAHPWDAIVLMFQTMTNELNVESYQTANKGWGSPKVGTPQIYTLFYNTGKMTASSTTNLRKLRWVIRLVNNPGAYFPSGVMTTDPNNTGSIKIHSINVDKVTF